MKIAKLLCGVAFGGFLATNAMAADLLYSQPAPQSPAAYGGPYVGIKGGVNFTNEDYRFDADAEGAAVATLDSIDTDTGFNAGLVAGYAFGSRWGMFSPRLEAELGYLSNDVDTFDVDPVGLAAPAVGELNATYGLVNLLLDIPLGWGFTPFIGAGIGYANVRFDNVATAGAPATILLNDEDTTFAWNLTAGLSYDISRNVTLEVAYRYLNFNDVEVVGAAAGSVITEDDVENHQVNVGIRVHL